MTLKKWIELQGGVRKTAEILGVTHAAVSRWVNGHNGPSKKMVIKIAIKSKGALSITELLSTKPKKKKKAKRK